MANTQFPDENGNIGGGGGVAGGGGNSGGGGNGGDISFPSMPKLKLPTPVKKPTLPNTSTPSVPRTRPSVPPKSLPPPPGKKGDDGETKPILPQPTPPPRAGERTLTYNADGALQTVIHGEIHNIGGAVAYWLPLSGGRLLVRYIIGYGPIESISNIRIDNLALTYLIPDSTQYEIFLGTPTQPVSTLFTANRPGWVPSRFPGVASVIILFPNYTDSTLSSFPDITNFKCDVKGLKIRDYSQDPTLTTRFFSEDAALIIADLLTSKRYGGRIPDVNVNFSEIASDVSPYIMQDIGGGVKRYPICSFINHSENLDTHLENLRAHAQLYINYNSGKYNILVDKPKTYSGIHFTDEDIDEGSKLRTKGTAEVFERINVSYTDSAQEWVQKSTPVELPNLSQNSVPINERDYSLLGTRTLDQAKRIGTYLINRSIQDKEITFSTNEVGKKALPGDWCKITDMELSLSAADIIITNCQPNNGGWDFTAEFYDEDVYSSVVQTEFVSIEPAYPSPHDIPPAPTSLVLTQEYIDHNIRVKIAFTPAPVSYNSQFTRIRVRRTFSSVTGPWILLPDTTDDKAYIFNTNDVGAIWDVELTTVTDAPYSLSSTSVLSGSITIAALGGFGGFGMIWPQYDNRKFLAAPADGSLGNVDFRIIVAADIPTLNQNTTGSAATLTTPRTINGVSFDGSANITVPAAAGTLTGTTLASNVVNSSLTTFGATPTLSVPIIASFLNANHNHQNATGGGTLDTAALTTGTLAAARMPALTGDVTTIAGAVATTLATVNALPGVYGTASQIPQFTVNAKGLVTSVTNVAIVIAQSAVTNLVSDLALKAPLANPIFTGNLTADSPTFFVDSTNHLIGIGTITPTVTVDIVTNVNLNSFIRVTNTNTGTSAAAVFRTTADVAIASLFSHASTRIVTRCGITLGSWNEILGSAGNGILINTNNSTPLVFGTTNLERMRIDSSGNIGIGTTNPSLFKMQLAGNVGPDTTFLYDLGSTATRWRTLYASELRVETLVAQNTIATIGGRILVGPTTKLIEDLTSGATTIKVEHNQMVSGDRIYLETAPGGVQQIEYMAITSGPTTITGGFSYTVTRNLDGTGADAWKAGDAVFNTGQAGSGFIDIYSVRGTKASTEIGPTIVGNIRNSTNYNDWAPRWAIGQLNGLYGYSSSTYGVAFGVPTGAWIKIDPTNGVRLGFDTTTNVQIDASGGAAFAGQITAASGTIGGWAIGVNTISSGGLVFNSATGAITGANFSLSASGISISSGTFAIAGFTVNASGNIGITGNIAASSAALTISDITASGTIKALIFQVGTHQVVKAQMSAVAHATNSTDVITQLNLLIDRLSETAGGHGLIA